MSLTTKARLVAAIAILLVFVMAAVIAGIQAKAGEAPVLKVGQVWKQCIGEAEDPFLREKGRVCYLKKILALREGYVQYSFYAEGGSNYDNHSETERWFLVGDNELIEDPSDG